MLGLGSTPLDHPIFELPKFNIHLPIDYSVKPIVVFSAVSLLGPLLSFRPLFDHEERRETWASLEYHS